MRRSTLPPFRPANFASACPPRGPCLTPTWRCFVSYPTAVCCVCCPAQTSGSFACYGMVCTPRRGTAIAGQAAPLQPNKESGSEAVWGCRMRCCIWYSTVLHTYHVLHAYLLSLSVCMYVYVCMEWKYWALSRCVPVRLSLSFFPFFFLPLPSFPASRFLLQLGTVSTYYYGPITKLFEQAHTSFGMHGTYVPRGQICM